jgi:hypothetical protein
MLSSGCRLGRPAYLSKSPLPFLPPVVLGCMTHSVQAAKSAASLVESTESTTACVKTLIVTLQARLVEYTEPGESPCPVQSAYIGGLQALIDELEAKEADLM